MRPLIEGHDHSRLLDLDRRGDVQQVAEDRLGLGLVVLPPDPVRHQAIQRAGHHRDLQVEIDLQAHHRRQGIEVEELDRLGDPVLDQHPLRVAGHQRRALALEVIRQQDRRLLVAQVDDRDLAQLPLVVLQPDPLIQDPGGAEAPRQAVQGDPPPRRGGAAPDRPQHGARATPQGHEADPTLIQAVEVGMRRQLRVEHQLGGDAPGPLLPERHELQDLVGLLRLGDAGIGIAEHALGGIAGEEDQDALLAAAPAGDVVLLQGLLLAVGRDGMEVEIERTAARQADPMRLVGPRLQQSQVGAAVDARAVRRQVRALGDDVEAGEQGDPLVADQVHDMTLALLAD